MAPAPSLSGRVPVMLPLYEKLDMDRRVLACACSLAAGVNFLPWTGPVLRASAASIFPCRSLPPLVPVQIVGLAYVFAMAWFWANGKSAG